ncbi:NAD(P)/FAD-dependent oxidoreductase [Sphingobacterium puteale]|uniref:NAD(P)/FAD-dependent oxidoreductase n=1 Tax=Sphingobacterium puteale TaxID=2420510 RepID=A0A420VSD5_9SPHI|nr:MULTISPECIES: NAD(P)/FAD-dependent oxidoreductase [Sphingobacterium]QIH34789.1 NAD(P)/FAD-dependent oxidoreductase [Sphingobacterium sp. DR205]RKO69185.1 NAD(P)/FAD-dependent oxidoreductase [Sphingobacterium puteale]
MNRRLFIKNGSLAVLSISVTSVFLKSNAMEKSNQKLYDTIIIGGSYSGLASAMTLGRSLRNVLVIDSGNPCNKQTPHSQNFLTRDGMPPGKIAEIAKEEVSNYPSIEFHKGLAANGKRISEGFQITTSDGQSFKGKILIFATGIIDIMHDITGFSECWGKSVIHCPYCHGYEFKGKKTAVLADGDKVMHFVSLIKNLTDDVTLITSGKSSMQMDSIAKLNRNGINVIQKKISEIGHNNGYVNQLIFSDGARESFDAVYAPLPFRQHCSIPQELGCEMTETGLVKIDSSQKTSVDGIYAVGDNSSPLRAVSLAVSSGNIAGFRVNSELAHDILL